MLHVGAVGAPVTRADVNAIAAEVWKAAGKAANAPEKPAVDILGCEFALELNETAYWFKADHKLKTGRPFRYHGSQQEAIETLIYVWEIEKIRTRTPWRYRKIPQKGFEVLRPPRLADLAALQSSH